ncbi:MAG: hypothetical protein KJ645_11260, partial [Planctomycetes bacterium]|nr:hypothetical protein [Planctomycetota bacterium]
VQADLFDSQTKGMVEERLRATELGAKEAEKLYREGKEAFAAREFAKALASLREVARIAPGSYEDVEALLLEVDSRLAEIGTLRSEVAEHFARINRGDFDLSYAIETLKEAERLFTIIDDQERESLVRDIAAGCSRLIDDQSDFLQKEFPLGDQSRGEKTGAFLSDHFIPLVESLPVERWLSLVRVSKECRRSLCGLFSVVKPELKMGFEAWKANLSPLLEIMRSGTLNKVLEACMPPKGASHPAVDWGEGLLDVFHRESLAKKDRYFTEAESILQKLSELCPQEFHSQMGRLRDELKRGGRQASLWSRLYRVRDFAKANLWVAAAALLSALIFYWLGVGAGQRDSLSWVADEVAHLQLESPALSETLALWIQESDDGNELLSRMQFLSAWKALIDAKENRISGTHLASQVGQAVLSRSVLDRQIQESTEEGDQEEARIFSDLGAELSREISRETGRLLEGIIRSARIRLSGSLRGGEGVLPMLSFKLEELHALVGEKELDDLRLWLQGFMEEGETKIRTPLGEAKRWEEFLPEEVLGMLQRRSARLSSEGERNLDNDLDLILRSELRRLLALGLKSAAESAALGEVDGYPLVIARMGNVLESLRGLELIDRKGATGILASSIEWINAFE